VSGNCLVKILVRESRLDTKTYMSSVGDDILKFNTYIKGLVYSLQERGESSTDLLINVNKDYMACKDK